MTAQRVLTSGYTVFSKARHTDKGAKKLAKELADWYRTHECKVLITDAIKEYVVTWKSKGV